MRRRRWFTSAHQVGIHTTRISFGRVWLKQLGVARLVRSADFLPNTFSVPVICIYARSRLIIIAKFQNPSRHNPKTLVAPRLNLTSAGRIGLGMARVWYSRNKLNDFMKMVCNMLKRMQNPYCQQISELHAHRIFDHGVRT